MSGELHEDWRQEARHVVGKGLDKGAESEDARVESHLLPIAGWLQLLRLLLELPPLSGHLGPDLAPQPRQQLGQRVVTHEAGVEQPAQDLGRLLPHRDVAVLQQRGGQGDHTGPQLVVG